MTKVHLQVNILFMREIIFYKTKSGSSPIEEFLDSLNSKQAQKVVWVMKIVEELETVPTTYYKKLKILMRFGKSEFNKATIYSGYLAFSKKKGWSF